MSVVEEHGQEQVMVEQVQEIGGYITLQGAAARSGYSEYQLRHLALHGRLRAKRLGRQVLLVEKRSLLEYVKRGETFARQSIPRGPRSAPRSA